jgi:hypothetical protein
LENRLAAWKPTADALDADVMLFAAGRASVRPSRLRYAWPSVAGLLTLVLVGQSIWLAGERGQRLALTQQLEEYKKPWAASPRSEPTGVPSEVPPAEALPPDSYLAARRMLERGFDAWPDRPAAADKPSNSAPSPEAQIPRAGQLNRFLDP